MLKTLLSALIISGSLVASATFAYAQAPQASNELDSEKSVQNFKTSNPDKAPIVVRIDPRTGTMEQMTLPAVPKNKEEAMKMVNDNAGNFQVVPKALIGTTPEEVSAIKEKATAAALEAPKSELDKDGGTPSWYRGGGFGYGYGYRGGFYGYGNRYGYGYGYGYGYPAYYYPYYNNYYPYYTAYYPSWYYNYGNYNYAYYGNCGW